MDAIVTGLLATQAAPVLRDLPLPLPLPAGVLAVILVLAFLAHILFVDLLLGGALLTLWAELRGRRDARLGLARAVAATITVNKSLAVVLGVAPLLAISSMPRLLLSGHHPHGPHVDQPRTHPHRRVPAPVRSQVPLGAVVPPAGAAARRAGTGGDLLLLVPLVFLSNVNLMLFPERWGGVRGFWSAAMLPNVLPRSAPCAPHSRSPGCSSRAGCAGPPTPPPHPVPGFTRPELIPFRLPAGARHLAGAAGAGSPELLHPAVARGDLGTGGHLHRRSPVRPGGHAQMGRELRETDAAVGRRVLDHRRPALGHGAIHGLGPPRLPRERRDAPPAHPDGAAGWATCPNGRFHHGPTPVTARIALAIRLSPTVDSAGRLLVNPARLSARMLRCRGTDSILRRIS